MCGPAVVTLDVLLRRVATKMDMEGKKVEEVTGEGVGNNDSRENKKKNNKNGPTVRSRAGEYSGAKKENNESGMITNSSTKQESSNPNSSFSREDLAKSRVVLDRRTKPKYSRHQSDRERKRIEREKRLLEDATEEEGIVLSLKDGYGFIRSNKRRENVYFHYSNLIIPEADKDNNNDDFELRGGQEVKFLVVTEMQPPERQNSTGSNRSNISGTGRSSVKISARQVQFLSRGSVSFQTVEAEGVKGVVVRAPSPRSPGSRNDDSKMGFVRLIDEQQDGGDIKGNILLHYTDAPGGVFTYQNHRNLTANALWIHEDDTLLFDVIKETVDGTLRAVPTRHKVGLGGSVVEPTVDVVTDDTDPKDKPAIRLVSVSLIGRAEGVIHALKPDFGFIHFAERPVDVYFKTCDLMPEELQNDIRRNMGIDQPSILEEEAAVHFDIYAHGNITTTTQRGRRRGAQPHARENIRGQRVVILPKSAIMLEKNLATNVKAVIKSANPQQLYTGSIELVEEEVKSMTMDERHPLVAKMIDSFLEESSSPKGRKSIIFRDTLGMDDDNVIIEMARLKGDGVLECSHIPMPGIESHPGRICIRRVENKESDAEGVSENEVETPKEEIETPKEEPEGKKKEKQTERAYKIIRFEKNSLDEALKDDVPPSVGDVITCDVIQNRRTGKLMIRNMKIVERKPVELTPTESSGVGVVKDIVARRDFGFISVLDENSKKSEQLFFHLPKDKRFVKGNEVKFDIALEGSKRVAINVEIAPIGTIPSAASKNACMGYILMEPSHTTLSNTPVRKATKAGGDRVGNGRWAEGNEDTKAVKQDMVEGGCILLLEDKTGVFQKKRSKSVDSSDGLSGDDELSSDEDNGVVSILSRINYNNGSIAIHGAGAASSMDGSTNPKRGDLVSFMKGRKRKTARDIRIVKRETAILQRGRLENIQIVENEDKKNKGKAQFIAATENQEVYDVDLTEVVSCAVSILKEKESMEGILHEGKIYGLCRTSDLYVASKLVGGTGKNRQRPKLNLTVKKDRGGTIMAQSMMAEGPDKTTGFKAGWTSRVSQYAISDEEEKVEGESNHEAGDKDDASDSKGKETED